MFQCLNKSILFFLFLSFYGCQIITTSNLPEINKRTTDYDLCFPMEYSEMFSHDEYKKFKFLRDVQVEIESRKLNCEDRFEAYEKLIYEYSNHSHVEETDLDKINDRIFNKKDCTVSRNKIRNCSSN
ncbi:MAG: hypothetical protein CL768_00245 [Chloroflexi bacterium]|nr:hypothetical protein [Chloroflexota bacterium]